MSPHDLFSILNGVALATWVALASFFRRPLVVNTIAGIVVPGILSAVYVLILLTAWRSSEGGFGSLEDVAALFANPWMLLAGWTHYLAFDLLVGVWEVRDAAVRRLPVPLLLACLALTFLFGPAGWLMYMTMRSVAARS